MSARAVLWALEIAPVTDATRALILVGLCERTNDDGRGAWPSLEWLARVARRDTRTVQRHLRALEDAGLIAPFECDHWQYMRLRGDRRPTAWAIAVPGLPAPGGLVVPVDNSSRGDADVTPSGVGNGPRGDTGDAHGVTPVTPRGDTGDAHGVTRMSPEPEEEPEGTRTGEPERARARASEALADVIDLRDSAAMTAARAALRARWPR